VSRPHEHVGRDKRVVDRSNENKDRCFAGTVIDIPRTDPRNSAGPGLNEPMKLDDETIDVLISGCLSKDHGLEPVRHRLSPCLERFQGQGDDLLGLLLGQPDVSTRALVDKPVRFQRDRG